MERSKYWLGNKPNFGLIGGKWRGVWASGFPVKSAQNAPVYMSYSASGWEWRNDLSSSSKLPAICEGKQAIDDKSYSKCLNNLCSINAQCSPTATAYTCKCHKGFFGSGFSCAPTNCPAGTILSGERCVKDQCAQCKPRFACRNEYLGTSKAACKCKEGWSGNGKFCLPKKNVARSDINSFAEDTNNVQAAAATVGASASNLAEMIDDANLKKSQSSGMAALNSLTAKLNQLQKMKNSNQAALSQANSQSLWRTETPRTRQPFAMNEFDPIIATVAPTVGNIRTSAGRVPPVPTPISVVSVQEPAIDIEELKNEMSDFAAEAARAHAKAVSDKMSSEQAQIQKEVDNVLELVQAYMTQSKQERQFMENELNRLKDFSNFFSTRIEEISSDVDQVENLKKSAMQEEQHYNQLQSIAAELRNEIFSIEDGLKSNAKLTEEKV